MSVWSREGLRGFLTTEGGCTEQSAADAIKYLDSSGNPILCDNTRGGPVRVTRHPDGAYEVLAADDLPARLKTQRQGEGLPGW